MNVMTVVVFLAIGAVAGWQGGNRMAGGGFGILKNILVGALGGVLGGYLFKILVFAAGGFIGSMVTAGAGAVALLYLVNLYYRTKKPAAIR